MKQSVVYIGIDVAKAHLDVAWAGTFRRLPNERSGHAALVRWIKQSATPVQLICEASGGYEQALLESMADQDIAKLRWCKQCVCARTRGRLASWPRPTGLMRKCSLPLAARCNRSQPRHSLPSKSVCVRT